MHSFYQEILKTLRNIRGIFRTCCVAGRTITSGELAGGFLSLWFLMLPVNAFAAAGDVISSTATVDYLIGGNSGSSTASITFVEDRRLNLVVSEADGNQAVPVISNMNNAVLQFSVSNTSNAVLDFLLRAENTSPNPYGLPADSFDPLPGSMRVYVESGINAGYQPAEDTGVYIDELAPGAARTVYAVASMPALVADDLAAIALIAQFAEGGAPGIEGAAINADDNNHTSPAGIFSNGSTSMPAGTPRNVPDAAATMQSVFNDPAGLNPEDISTDLNQDIAGNGQASDSGAWQQSSPVVINKTVSVIDSQGGSDPHPGSILRYQLLVSVVGNVAVDNLVISDAIPANTTYVDSSIVLNGSAQTDAMDAPADYSRAIDILNKPVVSIEVDLSRGGTVSVPPGSNNTIVFDVTIN